MYILNTKIQTNCLYSHYINLSIQLLIMWEWKRIEELFYFPPTISKVNYVFKMKIIHTTMNITYYCPNKKTHIYIMSWYKFILFAVGIKYYFQRGVKSQQIGLSFILILYSLIIPPLTAPVSLLLTLLIFCYFMKKYHR